LASLEEGEERSLRSGASSGRPAFLVATGIFLSRLAGLVRDRIFAHFFGHSAAADAFRAAFRIPNFLQNLFGEGVLSASFIPVYSQLLGRRDEEESRRLAGAIAAILGLAVSLLVLIGVLLAPVLISAIAPGFSGEKRELTIRLARILFPGAGLLALSAWCLGILNSHRRFFLSYAAPVAWNLVMIFSLLFFGNRLEQFPLAQAIAWASVAGSGLQFGVQFPVVMRLLKKLRPKLDFAMGSVRTVIRNFIPVFFSRGVTQISAYMDEFIASLLPTGAFAALSYAQTLYMLPISLFGMSVSAAELPAMSRAFGNMPDVADYLKRRLNSGLRRIAFFVLPAAMAFLALGDVLSGAIYQTGRFTRQDSLYLWGILAGAAVGLLATTLGRLYSSTFYALQDTRTPVRYAIFRVLLTVALGFFFALPLPKILGIPQRWGVAGLTVSAGLAGWMELLLLRRTLNQRIGRTGLPALFLAQLWISAAAAAACGLGLKLLFRAHHPILLAALVFGLYGGCYFLLTYAFRISEARGLLKPVLKLVRK
jgi:putative peptidoglycan lipid II flippase